MDLVVAVYSELAVCAFEDSHEPEIDSAYSHDLPFLLVKYTNVIHIR